MCYRNWFNYKVIPFDTGACLRRAPGKILKLLRKREKIYIELHCVVDNFSNVSIDDIVTLLLS